MRLLVSFLSLLVLTLSATPVWAANIYVSPLGDDTTGDGAIDSPYLTIQTALKNAATDDTIYLRSKNLGPFPAQHAIVAVDGVTITSEIPSSPAVLTSDTNYTLQILATGVTVENITFRGPQADSSILVDAPHCTIRDCTFEGDGSDYYYGGVLIRDDYCTVTGCTFSDAVGFGLGMEAADGTISFTSIQSCTFNDCVTYTDPVDDRIIGHGFGVYLKYDFATSLADCTFNGCTYGINTFDSQYGDFSNLTIDQYNGGRSFNFDYYTSGHTIRGCTINDSSQQNAYPTGFNFSKFASNISVTGCTITNIHEAFVLNSEYTNVVTDNTITNCTTGFYRVSFGSEGWAYFNVLNGVDTPILSSSFDAFRFGAPAPLFLSYVDGNTVTNSKKTIGNSYLPLQGEDSNGDGIRDTPERADPATDVADEYPLYGFDSFQDTSHMLITWYLGFDGTGQVLSRSSSKAGGLMGLFPDDPQVYVVDGTPSGAATSFERGAPGLGTSWNGWLTLSGPLALGKSLLVEVGHADPDSPAADKDFVSVMRQMLRGDGETSLFILKMPSAAMEVDMGREVAMRLTNPNDSTLSLITGGAHCALSPALGPGMALAPITNLLIP